MALADNKTSEANLEWDFETIQEELPTEMLEDWGVELPEDKIQEDVDLSGDIKETYEVIISCNGEEEQEKIFNELTKNGHECRILTL